MGRRVEEEGGSEGRPVIGRIGVEPSGNITPRESGLTSLWSFVTREPGQPTQEAKQMTAAATPAGAASHDGGGLARHRLAEGPSQRASAPGAYREGDAGGQMGQGQSLATSADPLVQRQGPGRPTSDGKPRQATLRAWTGRLWNTPEKKATAIARSAAARLPTPTAAAGVHPQEQRQDAPSGDSHDDRPGDAGALPAGPRSHRGDDRRPELLRVPAGTVDGRRHRTVPHGPEQPRRCRNGSSRATSSRASTGSATTGCWPTSPWTRPSSGNG